MLAIFPTVAGGKFIASGPVLTVTLKHPPPEPTDSFAASIGKSSTEKPWLDMTALAPNLFWSFASTSPPLPKWLPFWSSLRANVGYRYDELKRLPSFVETELKFRSERLNAELQIKPTYELKPKRTNLLVRASAGASNILAKFSINHQRRAVRDDDIEFETTPARSLHGVTFLQASYKLNFPPGSPVASIRITPALDVVQMEPTFELEGITGGSGRTTAILKLNSDNPTLAVIHELDDFNTISPEISLYKAKILYNWDVALPGGSHLRTKVDPTTAIEVQWTDTSASDGGRWVTDLKLPLSGVTVQALAADIKVRRQFNF